jgi:hypothetical protein
MRSRGAQRLVDRLRGAIDGVERGIAAAQERGERKATGGIIVNVEIAGDL